MTNNKNGQQDGNNSAAENTHGRMHSIKKGTSTLWGRNTELNEDQPNQTAPSAKSKHRLKGHVKNQPSDNNKQARPPSDKEKGMNKNSASG